MAGLESFTLEQLQQGLDGGFFTAEQAVFARQRISAEQGDASTQSSKAKGKKTKTVSVANTKANTSSDASRFAGR